MGFAGVLPLSHGLVQYYQYRSDGSDADDARTETEDALAELRERYARGELSDAEFERRVERLVGTESVSDAREYVERARDEQVSGRDASTERPADVDHRRALGPETDLERETE